jgi:type IV secretory pathway VirB2 component (pilin)
MPEYRRPVGGKLVAAVILLSIGASNIYGLEDWWPLLIIVAGIVIIFYGLQARKEPKA